MRFTKAEKTVALVGGALAAALVAAVYWTKPAAASPQSQSVPTISTYKNWTITIGQDPVNNAQWTFMVVGPNGGAVAPGTLFPSAQQALAGAQNAVDQYIANNVQA